MRMSLKTDVNRTAIETVLADLDLALTFAHIGATAGNSDTRNRNRGNARHAFLKIRDELLPMCSPDDFQRAVIDGKLTELQGRLEHLGEKFA
jgi:hypothetical protein